MDQNVGNEYIDTEGVNRTLCDVLQDMRKCFETRNFTSLIGLIEEAQIMGNKMESGLYDKTDVEDWTKARPILKKEIEELLQKRHDLKNEKRLYDEQIKEMHNIREELRKEIVNMKDFILFQKKGE